MAASCGDGEGVRAGILICVSFLLVSPAPVDEAGEPAAFLPGDEEGEWRCWFETESEDGELLPDSSTLLRAKGEGRTGM